MLRIGACPRREVLGLCVRLLLMKVPALFLMKALCGGTGRRTGLGIAVDGGLLTDHEISDTSITVGPAEVDLSVQSLRTSERPDDSKVTPPITTSRTSALDEEVGGRICGTAGGDCAAGLLAAGLLGGL